MKQVYDKSNVYKLSKEELEHIKENPLLEFDENKKKYAEDLYQRIINTGNMPYVLLINDSFGMGKTYFITRFSLYLYQKDINSIYISVKEQDYINDPLVIIFKRIYKFLSEGQFDTDKKTIVDRIIKKIEKIDVTVNAPFISVGCNIGQIIEKEKNIDDLKNELGKYIEETTNKKLVLIIDDLDRCDVSYVKRFLEVLKHVFDINGLYTILMGNKKLLETYENIDNNDIVAVRENFLTKYVDNTIPFISPNYEKIIDGYDLKDKLKGIHKNKYNNKRNSIDELKIEAMHYFKEHNFTLRQAKQVLEELVINAKNIKFEIDLPYLLYKIIIKNTNKRDSYGRKKDRIYFDHPLSDERKNREKELININISDIKANGERLEDRISFLKTDLKIPTNINIGEKIQLLNNILEKYNNEKENIFNSYGLFSTSFVAIEFKQQLLDFYGHKRDELKEFYEEWQIETDENELKQKYDNLF